MLQPADSPSLPPSLSPHVCQQALDARDARFDGLFYVGIVTTRIYCRPTCPSRRATPDHRRFYDSAAAAERAGFRPCLRCRPELAPGQTLAGAVSGLASRAAHRICAGALNGHSVTELAAELAVSERHLRRALRREIGVSPLELAQTQRLLLAKRLLADTRLAVIDIAFASGFESLRRFNVAFHERYGMSPSAVRRPAPAKAARTAPAGDLLRMTLAYRPPFAWGLLTAFLHREAMPGVEGVEGGRYRRTVRIDGRSGVIAVADAPAAAQLRIDLSPSLLPALMPLLARLRQLFDLDAQPAVVDAHLERGGLACLVRKRPGVRLPGALDGFEAGLRTLLRGAGAGPHAEAKGRELAGRVARALGEPLTTGIPGLDRLAPDAGRVAAAGAAGLRALGVPRRRAEALAAFARAVAGGTLALQPGNDAAETQRALRAITGIEERLAATIVMRALSWPDAFPASDRALQLAAGTASGRSFLAAAESWRPWRAYAALHLWADLQEG
jgi:AraC family transcriptional regulator of adaptative response / DNA-3-methyladenine glycosylase II